MKNIKSFRPAKYDTKQYCEIQEHIFQRNERFFMSLCFEQEPECGEGEFANEISQYPLEDILDKYNVYISDFYDDLNSEKLPICYLEFAGTSIEDIVNLAEIIGKRVYNRLEKSTGNVHLIIE